MRRRHRTQYPGVMYRTVGGREDGARRYIVFWIDANGRQHSETLPVGATLEDARLRKAALERSKAIVDVKRTVGLLLDEYLEARASSLKDKTYTDYEYGIKVVKDHMGSRKLKDLTANDCASLIAKLKKDGKKTWTVKKILTPLSGALKVAVREGWVASNPLEKLLPHERPKGDQRDMRCLSKDEIPVLLGAAGSDTWRTLFATLIFTGLRISEALALKWEDVESDRLIVREGKTKAAEREVMVIRELNFELKRHRLRQSPKAAASGYVFASRNGTPLLRREALRNLRRAEDNAGLPDYTLHELRHTFASILIAQGETPVLVASQMGHADPSVTLKTYAHLFDAAKNVELARTRLQDAFVGVV